MNIFDRLEIFGTLSKEEIISIENTLEIIFPDDYKDFLSKSNGGYPKSGYFVIKNSNLTDELLVNSFLGKSKDENFDIIGWNKEFAYELPLATFIFGVEYGGGMFIQILEGEDKGVYFWDSNFGLPGTTEDSNVFFLANTFSDFLSMITFEED